MTLPLWILIHFPINLFVAGMCAAWLQDDKTEKPLYKILAVVLFLVFGIELLILFYGAQLFMTVRKWLRRKKTSIEA